MANEIEVILRATDKASREFKLISGQLGRMVGQWATTAGAVAGFSKAVSFAIGEASEAQQVMAQTTAVIRSTGGAAGLTAEQIVAMAESFQTTTRFSDDAVQSMQNVLLTFTAISGPIFKDATQAVLDMSTALGTDLQGAAIQVGKALQDPILGVTALRRVGVNFNEASQETIRTMVESGRVMEAQRFILDELTTEFGGSATAATNTFAGAQDQLKNAWAANLEVAGQSAISFAELFRGIAGGLNTTREFARVAEELGFHIKLITPEQREWVEEIIRLRDAAEQAGPALEGIEAVRLGRIDTSGLIEGIGQAGSQIQQGLEGMPSIWDRVFPDPSELAGRLADQIAFIEAGGPQIVAAMNKVFEAAAAGEIAPEEARSQLGELQELALAIPVAAGDTNIWDAAEQHAADFGGTLAQAKLDILDAQAALDDLPRSIEIAVTLSGIPEGGAHGLSFTVGGVGAVDRGGPDDRMVAFPARTGERVDVTPQVGGGQGGGGGAGTFIFNIYGADDGVDIIDKIRTEIRRRL